jgi:hypothetical protein
MKNGPPFRFLKRDAKFGWRQCSEWHWQITLGNEFFDYWPHVGKYRWRGATYRNFNRTGVELLITEMKKILALPPSNVPPPLPNDLSAAPPWC